jgi:flagellar basal body-associated protein FliL
MLTVELLVAGLVVFLLAVLACMAWTIGHRKEEGSITEAQARENAAPLTTAILRSHRRERKRS